MNTGKDNNKFEFKLLPSKQAQLKVATTSKMLTNSSKQASKTTSTANAAIKAKSTTATVSKITKLVLKPRSTTPKSSLITKKYTTKPVTIKSRSTMISHESTFRIRNIKKSPPNKRHATKNTTEISVQSEQISRQLVVNAENFHVNQVIEPNETFQMEKSEQNSNITSLNGTKPVHNSILQEITSAVINTSNVVKSPLNDVQSKFVKKNVKENQKSPGKSETHCENDIDCKRKSYDPIKARQFIQKQREKWKEAEKMDKPNAKAPANKEEIKQRLSALRKSTLKIVEKNVQKARKSGVKSTNVKKFATKKSPETPKNATDAKQEAVVELQSSDLHTPQLQLLSQSKQVSSLVLTPSKFLPSIKSEKNRIGILRRQEGITPTFETALTPKMVRIKNTQRNSYIDVCPSPLRPVQANQNEHGLSVPQTHPLKSTLYDELSANFEQSLQEEQNRALDAQNNTEYKNDGNGENITPKKEIPFWLRPTPVQPYPYNFIMAIRKKLESITHPVFSIQQQQQKHTKPASYHSPVARPEARFMSQYRRNFDRRSSESESVSESVKSRDKSPMKMSNPIENFKEQSEPEEYSMDFTAVTVHSNQNQSDFLSKSKRRSVRVSQDTLSISSGILSHSSPEKKTKTTTSADKNVPNDDEIRPPSPLTTDNVDGLHITSQSLPYSERISNENGSTGHRTINASTHQSMQSSQSSSTARSKRKSIQDMSIASHINFARGKDYSNGRLPSFNKLSKQKNAEDLLKDFATSLSQVIEVNRRLNIILSNPPSRQSSKRSDTSENIGTEHGQSESVISEHITGTTHDSTSVRSHKAQSSAQNTLSALPSNSQYTESKNGDTIEQDKVMSSDNNTSTRNRIIEDFSGIISNEISVLSSTKNQIKSTYSMESQQIQTRTATEPISTVEKESSTLIEEKISDYQSSESPTNNDLKSVTLSIAKKSAATSDDTDQPSHANESFRKEIIGEADVANKSIGNDILNVFNKTSVNLGDDVNASIWSEHNISYSTLGVCDQLLKSETRKSQDLASLLKLREKTLIDRFKGQIAWLELQKQKFKANGLTAEISMIKKKQRALLLRLNKDRKELHRILKEHQQSNSTQKPSNVNFNISHMMTNMSIRRTSVSKQCNDVAPKQALKAIELPGGGSALEQMLQRRENELRQRRQHVEKLLKWHQRLDIEEQEVIKMEQMIIFISTSDVYQTTTSHEHVNDAVAITVQHHSQRTNRHHHHSDEVSVHERSLANVTDLDSMEQARAEHKKQKQIHQIEKSLNTLKMISAHSISSDIENGSNMCDDVVEIFGRQLNKLWKRLTGECVEKYTPEKVYTLSKYDLEQLYEQAKSVVLKQFHANEEFKRRLIDNSSIIDGSQNNNISLLQLSEVNDDSANENIKRDSIVPTLNLASSPEPRENVVSDTDQGYYFSNDNIEQNSEQLPREQQQRQEATIETVTTSDATSKNFDASQIQTEEQIEEEDEQSTSVQEDVQSDITEDSLNRPQQSHNENIDSEIKTVTNTIESQANKCEQSSSIPTNLEVKQPSGPFEFNLTGDSTQLIEETSFPNVDIQTTVSSIAEELSFVLSEEPLSPVKTASSLAPDEQQYPTDDFEEGKSANELTSISSATITQIATTTNTNQSPEQTREKSTEQSIDSSTARDESPKELEQRLILLDDGLRELSERISQSPVLQSEPENTQPESESSKSSKSSIDDENKSDQSSKTITGNVQTEATSKSSSESTTESETTTESTTSIENEPSAANDTPKIDSDESVDSIAAEIAASKSDQQLSPESIANKRPFQYTLSAGSIDYNKVPEADALKRSQVPLEAEAKTSEQSSAIFPLLREIPNKPPPPYPIERQVPKTPPFPSDERITEIVFNRIDELYEKPATDSVVETPVRSDATFVKSPTLSSSSADSSPVAQDDTNVFERIILDCCDEIMHEINTTAKQSGGIIKRSIKFFNPPNRLKCYQEHALKRVFKLLNRPPPSSNDNDSDESKPFSGMRSFLPSQVAQITYNNRRKRDAVDEILIQELYEDEERWTNFDLEEQEIRANVPDLRTLLADESTEIQETNESASNADETA